MRRAVSAIGLASAIVFGVTVLSADAVVVRRAPDVLPRARLVSIPELEGDPDRGRPVAISDDGAAAIGNGVSAAGREAFRWTAATGAVGLGDLPGGRHESEASHASRDGTVVVGTSDSAAGPEPFRWTAATGMEPLLPDGIGVGCSVTDVTPTADAMLVFCTDVYEGSAESDRARPDRFVWRTGGAIERVTVADGTLSHDGRVVVGTIWPEPYVEELARLEAGPDGRFDSSDDALHPLGISADLFSYLLRPLVSADASTVIAPSVNLLGQSWTSRWTIGADGLAGTPDDSVQDISTRSAGMAMCQSAGLSDDGAVAWGSCEVPSKGIPYPARWTASTGWKRLVPSLPGGPRISRASAGSRDGSVLVGSLVEPGSSADAPTWRPFRWTKAGGLSVFGTRPSRLDTVVISGDGTHVLGSEGDVGGQAFGLFVWSSGRGRRYVGDLFDGPASTVAQALSADGTVVAGAGRSNLGEYAFRWTEERGVETVGGGQPGPRLAQLSRDGRALLSTRDFWSGIVPGASQGPVLWTATRGVTKKLAMPHPAPRCGLHQLSPDGRTLFGWCSKDFRTTAFLSRIGGSTASSRSLPNPTGDPFAVCWSGPASADGSAVTLLCDGEIWKRAYRYRLASREVVEIGDPEAQQITIVGISADGTRIAGSVQSENAAGAYLWTQGAGLVLLPFLDEFDPILLSRDGSTVVGRASDALVRWRPGSGYEVIALPADAGGAPEAEVVASFDGSVVVGSAPDSDPSTPGRRIWMSDPTSGARWLDETLALYGVANADLAAGSIVAISDDGRRILGNRGVYDGTPGAWLAVLPGAAAP